MPFPFINGDAFEYYKIIDALGESSHNKIGFPGIGYPIILMLCEKIIDTTQFFIFVQSAIQLLAVLIFYYYYSKIFNKYLIYVAILIVGYVTSNINLYYDSAYHPDSLMGSLNIIILTLFMGLIYKPSYIRFVILSFIIVYSISIRANGIVNIVLVFIYLFFLFRTTNNLKLIFRYGFIFTLSSLILCTYYFVSPIYKTFNVISYPTAETETIYTGTKIVTSNHEIWKSILQLDLSKYLYASSEKVDNLWFNKENYASHVMALERGYVINQDSSSNIIIENYNETRSIWSRINLDTCINKNSPKELNNYSQLKKLLSTKYKNTKISVQPVVDFDHRMMNFVGFFNLFHQSIELHDDGIYLGYENRSFYNQNINSRYGNCYNSVINKQENQTQLKKVYKETYQLKKFNYNQLLNKMNGDHFKMESSRLYWYIITPFYNIQPFLFRNFLFPIVLIVVLICAMLGLILSKAKSPFYILLFLAFSLFLLTNYIFSCHFCYLYTRYTYQVSFVYYISAIFLPIMFESFLFFKKNKRFKEYLYP